MLEDFASCDLSGSFFLLERCVGSWSWRSRLPKHHNCFLGEGIYRRNCWKGTACSTLTFLFRKLCFFCVFFCDSTSQNQEENRLRKLRLFHRKPTPCWISWPLNQEATPREQKTPILPNICDWSNLLLNICHENSMPLLGGFNFCMFFHHYLVNWSNHIQSDEKESNELKQNRS